MSSRYVSLRLVTSRSRWPKAASATLASLALWWPPSPLRGSAFSTQLVNWLAFCQDVRKTYEDEEITRKNHEDEEKLNKQRWRCFLFYAVCWVKWMILLPVERTTLPQNGTRMQKMFSCLYAWSFDDTGWHMISLLYHLPHLHVCYIMDFVTNLDPFPTWDFRFYTSSCAAVACPSHSTGTDRTRRWKAVVCFSVQSCCFCFKADSLTQLCNTCFVLTFC